MGYILLRIFENIKTRNIWNSCPIFQNQYLKERYVISIDVYSTTSTLNDTSYQCTHMSGLYLQCYI